MNANNQMKLRTANIVIIAAGVAMLGITLFDVFAPKPKVQVQQAARVTNANKIRHETYAAKEKAKSEEAFMATRVWTEDVEQIGPKVLSRATEVAKGQGLTVSAFRPQRIVEDGTIMRVPFVLMISGTYPQVAKFVQTIEKPEGKVAVTLVQVSSSDGVSDSVTATIGLMALRDMKVKTPTKTEEPKKASGETTNG